MPLAIVVGTEEEIRAGNARIAFNKTETAAAVGISVRTLELMVRRGKITPYEERCLGSLVFLQDDALKLREDISKRGY